MSHLDTRDQLYEALRLYVCDKYGATDNEELENIFAGILAFIPTQMYKEPYVPLSLGFTVEEKKWYQFWK